MAARTKTASPETKSNEPTFTLPGPGPESNNRTVIIELIEQRTIKVVSSGTRFKGAFDQVGWPALNALAAAVCAALAASGLVAAPRWDCTYYETSEAWVPAVEIFITDDCDSAQLAQARRLAERVVNTLSMKPEDRTKQEDWGLDEVNTMLLRATIETSIAKPRPKIDKPIHGRTLDGAAVTLKKIGKKADLSDHAWKTEVINVRIGGFENTDKKRVIRVVRQAGSKPEDINFDEAKLDMETVDSTLFVDLNKLVDMNLSDQPYLIEVRTSTNVHGHLVRDFVSWVPANES